jgi:hypothetical protein
VLTQGPLCTLGEENTLFSLQEFQPNSFTVDRVLLWIGPADHADSSVAMRQQCHPFYNKLYCDKRTCLFPIGPIGNTVIERLTLLESTLYLSSVTRIRMQKDKLPFAHARNTYT